MAVVVTKVELKTVMDASGIESAIEAGTFAADKVVAVVGKTERNGGSTTSRASLRIRHSEACSGRSESAAKPTSPGFPWCGRAAATA